MTELPKGYVVQPIKLQSDPSILLGYAAVDAQGKPHPLGRYYHAQARNTLADCKRWASQTAYEANRALAIYQRRPETSTVAREWDGWAPAVTFTPVVPDPAAFPQPRVRKRLNPRVA
jgi:hypothetical protein